MARSSILILAGAAVLVGGVAVMMLRQLGDDPAVAASPQPAHEQVQVQPAPAPVPGAPTEPAPSAPAPAVRAEPSASMPQVAAPAPAGEPERAPAPPDDDPEVRRTWPVAGKPQLREQTAAVEPLLKSCIENFDKNATGKVVLTFELAPKAGKAVVETIGYDYDTTLDNTKLLDCMKNTANAMQFKPESDTVAIWVTREVVIEGGKLVTNRFIDYSRVH